MKRNWNDETWIWTMVIREKAFFDNIVWIEKNRKIKFAMIKKHFLDDLEYHLDSDTIKISK